MADNGTPVDRVSIDIGAATNQAIADIQKLVKALQGLKTAQAEARKSSSSGQAMKSMSTEAVNAMSKLDLMRMKLAALRLEMGKKMALGKLDAKGIADSALQVKKLQENINNAASVKFNPDASVSRVFKDMADTIGKNLVPGMKEFFKVLKSGVGIAWNLAKAIGRIGLGMVRGVLNGITGTVKTLGRWVTDAAKKTAGLLSSLLGFKGAIKTIESLKQAVSGLARIAVYRVARTAIKYVTDVLKEGSERAYFYAKEYGRATKYIADSLDALSGGEFKMSNQLGAAWSTMLATIEPILIRIISLVTAAADAVTRLFALLGGKGTYLKAVDDAHNWADETQKGAAAAKEWKNQLLGFDEINRLTEPSGSSGGAGDLYKDYENMFKEVEISGGIFDEIKEKIEQGDWAGLGKLLGEKLNDLTNSVDFAGFGKNIGEKLGAAVETAFNFLKTYDFKNLGNKLATMLDSLADEIDFNTLGRLVTRVRTAVWDVLYGAFTNPGSATKLANNLSNYIKGALDQFTDWIIRLSPQDIADAIKGFFGGIDGDGIMHSIKNVIILAWNKMIGTAHVLFPDGNISAVTDALKKFFDKIPWREIKDKIIEKFKWAWGYVSQKMDEIWPQDERDTFKEEVKARLTEVLKEAMQMAADAAFEMLPRRLKILFAGEGEDTGAGFVANLEKGISSKKGDMEAALDGSVKRPISSVIGDFLAKIFHARTAYALEADQLNEISDGVKDTAITDFDTMGKDVPKSVDSMQVRLSKATSLVSAGFEKMRSLSVKAGETMRTKVGEAWTGISTAAESVTSSMQTKVSTAWSNLQQNTDSMWNSIRLNLQNIWTNISTAAASTWAGIQARLATVWGNISRNANSAWTGMKTGILSVWDSMTGRITSSASSLTSSLSGIWSSMQSAASSAWTAIGSLAEATWNAISVSANAAWTSISSAANSAWGGIVSASGAAAESLAGIASGMADSISNAMSSIRTWLDEAIDNAWSAGSSIAAALDSALSTASQVASNVRSAVQSAVSNARSAASSAGSSVASTVGNAVSSAIAKLKKGLKKFSFADGGYPEEGPFFMNRGEIAGTFSNGRTVVANNRQITEGIAEATYGAFLRAMSDSGTGSGDRTVVINLDGREIARTTTKYQRQFARAAG